MLLYHLFLHNLYLLLFLQLELFYLQQIYFQLLYFHFLEHLLLNLAQQKLQLDREKFQGDMYNAAAEREVKREQMDTQMKIAKTNKNKYDKA